MKKRTFKGFTLIELIVVLAIFGIILAAATSMLLPTMKIMTLSDAEEEGNAAIASITDYLRGQLAPAESLTVENNVTLTVDAAGNITDDSVIRARVTDFISDYYAGIVRGGSGADDPKYGSATVHVMLIDNTKNGKISSLTYTCDLGEDSNATAAGMGARNLTRTEFTEYAVNRAYYNNFDFQIKFGNIPDQEVDLRDGSGNIVYEDDGVTPKKTTAFAASVDSFDSIASGLSADNTTLTILATTKRERNGKIFSFLDHATMSLVNIAALSGTARNNVYFTIGTVPKLEADGVTIARDINGNQINIPGIVDARTSASALWTGYSTNNPQAIVHGAGDPVPANGYCFIYASGSEIDTTP